MFASPSPTAWTIIPHVAQNSMGSPVLTCAPPAGIPQPALSQPAATRLGVDARSHLAFRCEMRAAVPAFAALLPLDHLRQPGRKGRRALGSGGSWGLVMHRQRLFPAPG